MSNSEESSIMSTEEEFIWCCRREFDMNDMIKCGSRDSDSNCPENSWFHYSCINLDPEEVFRIEKFICNRCSKGTRERTTYYKRSELPEDPKDQPQAEIVQPQPETSQAVEEANNLDQPQAEILQPQPDHRSSLHCHSRRWKNKRGVHY